ncbi:leucine-rich repeat domain-containing protein [Tenacibaculum caenipelagi]|uniref:Leucine rich repeat (LRR) protein n=1 Tax=Tenacibaculum caenipelagi TaxID=1325435 RepID=A0A4R6TCT1_9FLAO|nr:hypothetical protein [Tenacibaculum caenipelagi]TDQ27467.1 hypothetical protein DFQ07_1318 [Tenacibaculum caenipelagi]
MKRYLKQLSFILLSCCLFISCSSDEHTEEQNYLNIPDAQFETKLINLDIDSDGIVNQQLLKSDALGVTSLNLNTSNDDIITDLTGIEGFINLKRLHATGNNLTTIDLRLNKQLDTLVLAGNSLKNIDLSNNTKLIKLDLDVNELSIITGLKNATNLKWLSLYYNSLETLSIDNPNLETLNVRDNFLMSLDVKKAISLKTILAQNNKLLEVDFTANKALEVLALSDNKLKNIDLESNSNIEVLYCSSNLLTSLDVSGLVNLNRLTVNANPSLFCIKIHNGQNIPIFFKSDYQEFNTICD